MDAFFLTENRDGPSARARVRALLPRLRARGLEVGWEAIGRRGRRALFREAGKARTVVLQRRLLSPWDALALRRSCRRLVFDFDDALPFRDSNRGATRSWARSLKFRTIVGLADACVAGNPYLAALAGDARVIPTAVGLAPDPPEPPRRVLGWLGSASNLVYLERLRPVFAALWEERRDWELHVVCDAFPAWPELPLVRIPWSAEAEAPALAGFAIGLAPLADDPWTRGKCGMKLLRYLAAGIPAVASPVGVQPAILGDAGSLAEETDAWRSAILRLWEDADHYAGCAARARARVRDGFLLDQAADAWREVLA